MRRQTEITRLQNAEKNPLSTAGYSQPYEKSYLIHFKIMFAVSGRQFSILAFRLRLQRLISKQGL